MEKKKKVNNNEFGYAEVIGTIIMILSSCFFITAFIMTVLG